MSYFRNNEYPSCSICDYATEYIPLFTYSHADPYCKQGHGKCEVDKVCSDFKPISVCGRCEFLQKDNLSFICVHHNKSVSFNDKNCDEFKFKEGFC